MAGILIIELRWKINRVKLAFGWQNNEQFADAINRKPSTLSDYFKDRTGYEKNAIPPDALAAMANLLVSALGNTVTVDEARNLWCGSKIDFEAAFERASASDFRQILSAGGRAEILRFERHPRPLTLKMIDFMDDESVDAKTQVRDTFHFDCSGPEGQWLVLLVESLIGFQLAWPRGDGPTRFAATGPMRVPGGTLCWEFPVRGLHRFIAFAIESERPPSLTGLGKRLSRLSDRELDRFAAELKNSARTRAWVFDIFEVSVLDKDSFE